MEHVFSQILKYKKEEISNFPQKIKETPLLTDRNWLLEVIQNVAQKKR